MQLFETLTILIPHHFPRSALNLIVFGPKLEHLDLIEYVVVDLLKVKWNSFVRREFFIQMGIFSIFFGISNTLNLNLTLGTWPQS